MRPAPRRLPESRRVKRPVIGGSWKYTKDSGGAQGATRKIRQSIDICNRFLYRILKLQRPLAYRLEALPRIGRASRSDINPLTGSDGSVPHRRAWCKGVREKRGSSHQVRISFFSITPLRTGKACGIISSSQPPRLSAVRHDARIWRLLFYADTKPYQSIEQQIALLESRGLAIDVDADVAKRFLANVNYYRQNRSDLF